MKKKLFGFVFSIITVIAGLFLVEMFFQLNSYLNLVEIKTVDYDKAYIQTVFDAPPTPKYIITELIKKYENFKPENYDRALDLFNSQKNKIRRSAPHVPQKFISMVDFKFEAPFKITDKSINTKFDITIFDSTYEFDSHRRRVVKNQKINAKSKNIVLIGCSLAFGVGVNQGEELASHLHARMPKYNIYNLGIPGAGMNQMLEDALVYKRLEDLNTQGGAVIYIMIYPHLERTFCSTACHSPSQDWMARQNKNIYEFNESGELVPTGAYNNINPAQYWTRELLAKSEALKFMGYDNPKRYDDDHIDKYIHFLKYLQSFYKSKNLDFYLFLPTQNKLFPPTFMAQLEKNSIKSFAYRNNQVLEWFAGRLNIPGDGHWNIMGNDFQSALIADYLKSQGY